MVIYGMSLVKYDLKGVLFYYTSLNHIIRFYANNITYFIIDFILVPLYFRRYLKNITIK